MTYDFYKITNLLFYTCFIYRIYLYLADNGKKSKNSLQSIFWYFNDYCAMARSIWRRNCLDSKPSWNSTLQAEYCHARNFLFAAGNLYADSFSPYTLCRKRNSKEKKRLRENCNDLSLKTPFWEFTVESANDTLNIGTKVLGWMKEHFICVFIDQFALVNKWNNNDDLEGNR